MSDKGTNQEIGGTNQENNEQNTIARDSTSPSQDKISTQAYIDYSDAEEIPIGAKEEMLLEQYNENLLKGPFPFKLHIVLKVLDQEGSHDIMSWNSHGRSFIIKNHHKFEAEVMPRFFKTNQLSSFRRQLNLYEFVRINEGSESGSYYHELFLRTKPLLSLKLERINRKSPDRLKQACPKFETMKMLPKLVHRVPLSLSKAPAKITSMGMRLQGPGMNMYGHGNSYGIGSGSSLGMNMEGMGANFSRVNPNALGSMGASGMTIERQLLEMAQQNIPFQQMQLQNTFLGGNNMNNANNMGISLNNLQSGFLGGNFMNNGGNNLTSGDGMSNMNRMLGNYNNSGDQRMMNMNNIGNNFNLRAGGMNNMMTNLGNGAISNMIANLGGGSSHTVMGGNRGDGSMSNIDGRISNNVTNMVGGSVSNIGGAINNMLAGNLNNLGSQSVSMISGTQNHLNKMGSGDVSNKAFANSHQLQMQQQQAPWNRNAELNSMPLTISERQQLMMLQQQENARQNSSSGGNFNATFYNYSNLKQTDQQNDTKNDLSNAVDKKRKSNCDNDEIVSDGLGSYLRRRGRENRSSAESMGGYNYEEASFTSSKKRLEHETKSSRKSSKSGNGMHDLTIAALKMANISFPSDIGSSQWTLDVRSDDLNIAKTFMSVQSERGSESAFGTFQRRVPTHSNSESQRERSNKISKYSEMHHDVHHEKNNS